PGPDHAARAGPRGADRAGRRLLPRGLLAQGQRRCRLRPLSGAHGPRPRCPGRRRPRPPERLSRTETRRRAGRRIHGGDPSPRPPRAVPPVPRPPAGGVAAAPGGGGGPGRRPPLSRGARRPRRPPPPPRQRHPPPPLLPPRGRDTGGGGAERRRPADGPTPS